MADSAANRQLQRDDALVREAYAATRNDPFISHSHWQRVAHQALFERYILLKHTASEYANFLRKCQNRGEDDVDDQLGFMVRPFHAC